MMSPPPQRFENVIFEFSYSFCTDRIDEKESEGEINEREDEVEGQGSPSVCFKEEFESLSEG